ncbi:hypothetical protein MTBUT4_90142 [Magnetospirillum sp. UT-4]|nr:hypothetical protein MTBUT4_90142 [Magnetospirillum sp. UT-4]
MKYTISERLDLEMEAGAGRQPDPRRTGRQRLQCPQCRRLSYRTLKADVVRNQLHPLAYNVSNSAPWP